MTSVKIPDLKVILCGEYSVGKSSIFRRFRDNTFVSTSGKNCTVGLDCATKLYNINDRNIKLQLWDTGGMERAASITSSYYKNAEAAVLIYSLDDPASFQALSQHLLDIVTLAENAKIFLCGTKSDLVSDPPGILDADIEAFCEQCKDLITKTYKVSCKMGDGVDEMFEDIALHLVQSSRSRIELQLMEQHGFKLVPDEVETPEDDNCAC